MSEEGDDNFIDIEDGDEYKKQRDMLKNELEIIKKNNDKMNAIKVNNNIKAQSNQKLQDTINNLTNEKNNLKNKNDILLKKIEDLDKEKYRSKSLPKKRILHKPKTFKNLKKITNDKFSLIKGDAKSSKTTNITNKNKGKNNVKNNVKNKKKKFEKLNITKNAVNVLIMPKDGKKDKKQDNKDDKKGNEVAPVPAEKKNSFKDIKINNIESFIFTGIEKKNENKENGSDEGKNNDNSKEIDELMKKILEKENKIKSLENQISELNNIKVNENKDVINEEDINKKNQENEEIINSFS